MVLIGFGVDVSSFLGELRAERDQRHLMAREILDWACLGEVESRGLSLAL